MKKWAMASWALILVLALGVPAAFAQQQKDPRLNPPVAPLPPITPGESTSRSTLDDPVPPQNAVKPDESPLSGAEGFTLGTSAGARSYVSPSIRYSQIGDNSGRTSGSTNALWRTTGTMIGSISLQRLTGRSQMTIDYSGGGMLFDTLGSPRGSFHRLGISEHLTFRRLTILLADSMTYLPESSFGAGGIGGISTGLFGGLGSGGIGTGGFGSGFGGFAGGGFGGGLVPGISPTQSILTGIGRRISNTSLGQIQYALGPRSSFTASGSYGLLRFLDSGFIESNNYRFMAGYDYKLNKSDTIGVIYSMNMMRFTGIAQSADVHTVHLAYGRRLTGRMALRLSGGPQFGQFDNAVIGSSSRVSWSVRSSLIVNFRSTDLGLNYMHATTTGSGVLVGADTDQVNGSLHKQITRMWSAGFTGGFARNHSIRQLNLTGVERIVKTWHGGFNLQRPLNRQASLSFVYDVSGQLGNNPVGCTGITCGRLPIRHHLALLISWGFGPYAID
jgi:hypothetical protein